MSCPYLSRPHRHIIGALARQVRTRQAGGESAESIGQALDLAPDHVRRYLLLRSLAPVRRGSPLVGTDPSRSIRGLLCRLVRRLRADGQTAEVIGRALNLEVTAVEAYLFPPSPPPKLPGTTNGGGRAD